MKRKQFTGEFKAKVAIEALKGHKTISELSSEFGIHSSQVNLWKRELLTGANTLFRKGQQKQAEDHEAEKDRLYNQIGRLKVEVDWLQKKVGHLN